MGEGKQPRAKGPLGAWLYGGGALASWEMKIIRDRYGEVGNNWKMIVDQGGLSRSRKPVTVGKFAVTYELHDPAKEGVAPPLMKFVGTLPAESSPGNYIVGRLPAHLKVRLPGEFLKAPRTGAKAVKAFHKKQAEVPRKIYSTEKEAALAFDARVREAAAKTVSHSQITKAAPLPVSQYAA